jgi:gliding motility associated protien GldN
MKRIASFLSVFVCVTLINNLVAQPEVNGGPINVPSNGVIDGVFIQEHIPTKKMVPLETVREADVIWSRQIFQSIDLREKINHPLYYPFDEINNDEWVRNSSRWSLWTIIRNSIVEGDNLTVYDNENPNALGKFDGDQFKYPIISSVIGGNYKNDSILKKNINRVLGFESEPKTDENGNFIALTSIVDPESDSLDINGNPVYPPRDMVWITSRDVVAYQLKENWFFDKERSVMDVRIIGIAPVVYFNEKGKPIVTDPATGSLSDKIYTQRPLFWLYYPQLRYIINNYFVYNDENDAQWMSFDDLFLKRRFNSTIIKESNNYDRNIESYRNGIDALMESEKIKEEIRNIEHDVWSF